MKLYTIQCRCNGNLTTIGNIYTEYEQARTQVHNLLSETENVYNCFVITEYDTEEPSQNGLLTKTRRINPATNKFYPL